MKSQLLKDLISGAKSVPNNTDIAVQQVSKPINLELSKDVRNQTKSIG